MIYASKRPQQPEVVMVYKDRCLFNVYSSVPMRVYTIAMEYGHEPAKEYDSVVVNPEEITRLKREGHCVVFKEDGEPLMEGRDMLEGDISGRCVFCGDRLEVDQLLYCTHCNKVMNPMSEPAAPEQTHSPTGWTVECDRCHFKQDFTENDKASALRSAQVHYAWKINPEKCIHCPDK